MPRASTVELTLNRHVATLTLHGEKSINIINGPMMDDLTRAGEPLFRDPDLRLVILTGAPGRGFIGGADIAEMSGLDADSARAHITRLHQACQMFRALPVPSIARVTRYCLGAGMEIAAACDLRIGATDSRYGMPEVQVGLPSVIEAVLLPTLIGWGYTRLLLYTGSIIDAAEAHRIGFLQGVASEAALDSAMHPWVEAILQAEPGAIRTQKRLIEGWLDSSPAAGVQASIDAFAATFRTDAPNRRLSEWVQRRAPARGAKPHKR